MIREVPTFLHEDSEPFFHFVPLGFSSSEKISISGYLFCQERYGVM